MSFAEFSSFYALALKDLGLNEIEALTVAGFPVLMVSCLEVFRLLVS